MTDKADEQKIRKPLILIVDDNPKNLQVLGTLLRKTDCNLAAALSGKQALNTIEKVKPDLILLDVMMPEMDGHEVCRRLKSNKETKHIPVIFLSAKSETEDVVAGFELGAVDYISKPFIGSELLARVNTQLVLKKMKDSHAEEISTKGKFFSIIAHDLRESFGMILNSVQLLKNECNILSVEETDDLLGNMENTTKNTLDLLENLLEWAKSQTGNIRYCPGKVKLNGVVSEVLKSAGDMAHRKNIEIKSALSPVSVFADRNMLLLILRNLITNALKFTPSGGSISLSTVSLNGKIKIQVSDSGVGMAPGKIEKLFKIENKVSTPGTENEPGNGLGLILCREFTQQHGGEMGIESTPGVGTSVWFTLPLNESESVNVQPE
ncbi:MAG TPA: hybrid sensor histidine kinase/response regulator [Mariniphaga anaerophila]|uniref:histidine kinase n=1 Tax=Mariniphaga anaerophila TaxID=1484053 RepID=A0A831LIW1_9BACT|nr:hybrid sensor histidine kinase/response regulator [Mariniphaga anaerophila]